MLMVCYQGWFVFVFVLVIVVGMFLVWMLLELGFDLWGGSQFIVEVKLVGEIIWVGVEEMEVVKVVFDCWVNGFGVVEFILQMVGELQFVLQFLGEQDFIFVVWVFGDIVLLEFCV